MSYLSIIIPTYNEEKSIIQNLCFLRDYLDTITPHYEIIIVDDGSIDSTCLRVENAKKTVTAKIVLLTNQNNQGKGAVIKQGILYAKGEFVFFTDADLPYNLSFIKLGLEKLSDGYEMVAGSRYETNKESISINSNIRTLSSRIFRAIAHILIHTEATDTQCGFKGFNHDVATKLFKLSIIKGFGFDIEILFLANKYKISIANLPVKYSGIERESRIQLLHDSFNILLETISVLRNNYKGKYN
jgi:dolichyl-phosphate beta-glucosyltransferase